MPKGLTGASGRDAASADPVPLRRNRDFLLLWTGQSIAALGGSMAAIVYPLIALAATRSAAQAGLVGFAGMATGVLLRLPAGVLVDRSARKPLMVAADLVRFAVVGSIVVAVVLDGLSLAHLVVAAVISSACGVVFDPAQAVAVRHVVPPKQLPQALAQNEARGYIAELSGQPLGGFLYGIGMAVPIAVHALSYLVSGAMIAGIRGSLRDPAPDPDAHSDAEPTGGPVAGAKDGSALSSIWHDIQVGIRFLLRQPFLRVSFGVAAGFQIVFAGLSLVIIAYTTAAGVSTMQIGLAFSLGAIGGIAGAWVAPRMQNRLSPATLLWTFGWTASAVVALLGFTRNPFLIGALLGMLYLTAVPANSMLFAAQIEATPSELQGRVLSAAMLVAGSAAPLGPLLGGFLADHLSQADTFLIFAAISAALTVLMHASRFIRTMLRPGSTQPIHTTDPPDGSTGWAFYRGRRRQR